MTGCAALGACLLLAAAAPAAAQGEQTPEGARRFLEQVLPGVVVQVPGGTWRIEIVSINPPTDDGCHLGYRDIQLTDNNSPGIHGFDFADVFEIRAEGTDVVVVQRHVTVNWRIGSEAMAARVAYALEFLRQRCDRTADTGF